MNTPSLRLSPRATSGATTPNTDGDTMPITLTWNDTNTTETGHKVYRSLSPMTVGSLPVAIATLGANVTSYTDSDVVEGQTYYYRVAAVRNTSEAVSSEIIVQAVVANLLVAPSGLVLELVAEVPRPTIGEYWEGQGGYYAGEITYADGRKFDLLVADKSADVNGLTWSSVEVDLGTGIEDGLANTEMISQAASEYPSGDYCASYAGEGMTDWYLPSIMELSAIYLKLGFNVEGCPDNFKAGGSQAFDNGYYYYWSSSEYTDKYARRINFYDGTVTTSQSTSTSKTATSVKRRTRPIRRVAVAV